MLSIEERGDVTIVRMAHRRANALDLELCRALSRGVRDLTESNARAVVLTGSGTIFSAGADLFRVVEGDRDYIHEFVTALGIALVDLFSFPRPVVAALNGHAIAGGCILACACDYRIMAQGPGTIGVPELLVGVPFPAAAVEILRFTVSGDRLQQLAYVGRTYLPDQALEETLVDEVVPADQLLDRACELAVHMGRIPSLSFAAAKRGVRRVTLDRIARYSQEMDPDVIDIWQQPETLAFVRQYLERVVPARKTRPDGAREEAR